MEIQIEGKQELQGEIDAPVADEVDVAAPFLQL